MRRRFSLLQIVVAIALLSGPGTIPAARAAAPSAPGWSSVPFGDGSRVTWRTDAPLPITNARLEVRRQGELLGFAHEVGTAAVFDSPEPVPDLTGLELWRGGRRIDVPAPSTRSPRGDIPSATPTLPLPPLDPGIRGPYSTERLHYELAPMKWREFPAPVEVVAEVTAPIGMRSARPLVLLLHGRHSTCYIRDTPSGDWPCPAGWRPVPSHLGYRTITDLLASQGYIAVSISANGINGQDFQSSDGGAAARSALIRRHLAQWTAWAASGGEPWARRFHHRVDLTRVVLIGHSRGGEGVARAAIDSRAVDPWKIRGLVAIAPTAFGQQVPAYVHTLVLLPYCDGDVYDLQGQVYVDGDRDLVTGGDPSLRSAVLVLGANHNFFNAQWTPGLAEAPAEDDWFLGGDPDDPCSAETSPQRLSPATQQAVGATYSAALVQLAVDHREVTRLLLDGRFGAPESAARADVRVSAIGGGRTPIYEPGVLGHATASGSVKAVVCNGYVSDTGAACPHGSFVSRAPHWIVPLVAPSKPAPKALELRWNGSGAVRLAAWGPSNLEDAKRIDVRIAIHPATKVADLALRIIDANGRTRTLATDAPALRDLPGNDFDQTDTIWAQTLRGFLNGVDDVDLHRIVAMELVVRHGAGRAYLLDAMAVARRPPRVPLTYLPRLDVGTVDVKEGDRAGTLVEVPINVIGTVVRPGRLWVEAFQGLRAGHWVDIRPGTSALHIRLLYDGDIQPTGDRLIPVAILAGSDVATGQYIGGAFVHEDDPFPPVAIDDVDVAGSEASGLRWTFRIPAAVSYRIFMNATFTAPGPPATEIDSDDVSPETWFSWTFSDPPRPPMHPSETLAFIFLSIPPGRTSVSLTVPFVVDGRVEGAEAVQLVAHLPDGASRMIRGTVSDT